MDALLGRQYWKFHPDENKTSSCKGEETMKTKPFTFTKFLFVMAMIAILAAMLLPLLSKTRDKAHSIQCLNNLRQLSLVSVMYSQNYEAYCPPRYTIDKNFSSVYWFATQIYRYSSEHWMYKYSDSHFDWSFLQPSDYYPPVLEFIYGAHRPPIATAQSLVSATMSRRKTSSSGRRNARHMRLHRDQPVLGSAYTVSDTNSRLKFIHLGRLNATFLDGHEQALKYTTIHKNWTSR